MSSLDAILAKIEEGFASLSKDDGDQGDKALTMEALAEQQAAISSRLDELFDIVAGDSDDSLTKAVSEVGAAVQAHQEILEKIFDESGATAERRSAAGDDEDDDGDDESKEGRKKTEKSADGFDNVLRRLARGSGQSVTLN